MRIVSRKYSGKITRERIEVAGTTYAAYFTDRVRDGAKVLNITADVTVGDERRSWTVELSEDELRRLFEHLSHNAVKAWERDMERNK